MIDYATYQRIHHLHRVEQLTVAQIAHAVELDARTVRHWLDEPRFRPRITPARPSKLDPFKGLPAPAAGTDSRRTPSFPQYSRTPHRSTPR